MPIPAHMLLMAGGADSPFAPTDISGCALWLDAADAATITHSLGVVSQWNDKSGNARHVTQSLGGAQPTTGTRTQNSLNVIDFDGIGDFLKRSSFWYSLVTSTAFVVMKVDTIPDGTGLGTAIYEMNTGSSPPEYGLRYTATQANFVYVTDGNVVKFNINDGDMVDANGHLITLTDSGTVSSVQVDNGSTATSSSYTRATSTFNQFAIGILENPSTSFRRLDGWVAEIIIYNSVLSAGDISTVKGYLQTRWAV